MLLIKNYLLFSLPKVKNNKWTKILSTMYLISGESGCGDFSYTVVVGQTLCLLKQHILTWLPHNNE